ncbi:MAG: hypothetical protein ACQESQ_08760 [Bacteroidota bacterium]
MNCLAYLGYSGDVDPISMSDDTGIDLAFILERNEYDDIDLFEIKNELDNTMKPSMNHFPGEIY